MRVTLTGWLLLASVLTAFAEQPSPKKTEKSAMAADPIPAYQISFKAVDGMQSIPIPGLMAGRLPVNDPGCASDGTALLHLMEFPPSGWPISSYYSVSPSQEANSFSFDQAPKIYDLIAGEGYIGESEVVFEVSGATEYKEGKGYAWLDSGETKEWKANAAEHHSYILAYGRDGRFKRMVQLDDSFRIHVLGVFSGRTFLAYGFDNVSKSPRLALIKEDGTLLQYLQLPDNYLPPYLKKAQDEENRRPSEPRAINIGRVLLAPADPYIIVAAVDSHLPLLEVSEAGAVRAIPLKVPKDEIVETVFASETSLYLRIKPASESSEKQVGKFQPAKKDVFYEISREDATIRKKLEVAGKAGTRVACVHDNDFLSFDYSGDGKLHPLIGTAEPASNAATAQPITDQQ